MNSHDRRNIKMTEAFQFEIFIGEKQSIPILVYNHCATFKMIHAKRL